VTWQNPQEKDGKDGKQKILSEPGTFSARFTNQKQPDVAAEYFEKP